MITIHRITAQNAAALTLPNLPFQQTEEAQITYCNHHWSLELIPSPVISYEHFPDAHYSLETIDQNGFALGAFEDNLTCIGLALFETHYPNSLYLADLNVQPAAQRQGVASRLLTEATKIARQKGYQRLETIAQHTNGAACRFYLHYGFEVGGYQTMRYTGTAQAAKHDISFYLPLHY